MKSRKRLIFGLVPFLFVALLAPRMPTSPNHDVDGGGKTGNCVEARGSVAGRCPRGDGYAAPSWRPSNVPDRDPRRIPRR